MVKNILFCYNFSSFCCKKNGFLKRGSVMGFFTKERVISNVVLLPIKDIVKNPAQPRVIFSKDDLKNLAESIKYNGILQPITVRINKDNLYELVAGERRLKAAKLAGNTEVPCLILKTNEEQSAIFALIENLQRKNLNFFEEALAISKLIKKWNLTQDEVAIKLGKAQSTIANKLRLLKFSDEQKATILTNNLTERHSRALLKISSDEKIDELLRIIVEKKLNVSQTEELVEKCLDNNVKKIKKTFIPIIKDVRIFYNTINKAVKTMRKAGVMAKVQKTEEEGYIKYIVKIPNSKKHPNTNKHSVSGK